MLSLLPAGDGRPAHGALRQGPILHRRGPARQGALHQEVVGSEEADFTIRILQSDGPEYEVTEKMADGTMRDVDHRKEGPVVVVQTTTRSTCTPRTRPRVFPIYVDESPGRPGASSTATCRRRGRGVAPQERERILERCSDAIRLLEPARGGHPLRPKRIQMPVSPVRVRRDASRLLDLIRVIAWLTPAPARARRAGPHRRHRGRLPQGPRTWSPNRSRAPGSPSRPPRRP